MNTALIIATLLAVPVGAFFVSWHMSGRTWSAWLTTWLWADDPEPYYSRLDRMDGLGHD